MGGILRRFKISSNWENFLINAFLVSFKGPDEKISIQPGNIGANS